MVDVEHVIRNVKSSRAFDPDEMLKVMLKQFDEPGVEYLQNLNIIENFPELRTLFLLLILS